jgi:hypothetical protein
MGTFSEDINKIKDATVTTPVEVSEETFDEMLGAVPPSYMKGNRFACGEAYHFNSKGEETFYCFFMIGEKCFGFLGTIKEIKEMN